MYSNLCTEYKLLKEFAEKEGIAYGSMAELCSNEKVVNMILARIDLLQQEFANYEKVKRITLLPEPFSMERGELTNTLKIKRPMLNLNYKEQIEAMYK